MNLPDRSDQQSDRTAVTVLVLLTFAFTFIAGYLVVTDRQFRAVRLLNSAFSVINHMALEAPGADSLMLAAADGMMSALDPYCEFLPPLRWETMREETEGLYSGIGVEMVIFDGVITVVSPIPESPAYRAGIRPGDRIVEIDGESAGGITSGEAAERLRGPQGSKVVLGIERPNLDYRLTFELEREEIAIQPVSFAGMTPEGIGYVRLARFSPGAGEMLDSILHRFLASGSTAWILDLRGNPGGFLDEAVDVAGCFLPEGSLICETHGQHRWASFSLFAENEPVSTDLPLVILIDGGSASASEIVAAAIADHARGVIVGRRSFGKGLVQSLSELDDRHAIQLTTGRYFTPGGYSFSDSRREEDTDTIQSDGVGGGGLIPHVAVESEGFSALEVELMQEGTFLNYVASVLDTAAGKSFDDLWDLFFALIGGEEAQFGTPLEYAIARAESAATHSPIAHQWGKAFARLRVPTQADRAVELADILPRLKIRLAESIVFFGNELGASYLAQYLLLDKDTRSAIEIFTDPGRYRSILVSSLARHSTSNIHKEQDR